MPVTLVANDDVPVVFTDEEIKYVKMATDILGDEPTEGEVPATNVNSDVLKNVKAFLALRVASPMGTIKKPLRDKTDMTKSGLNEQFATWIETLTLDQVFALLTGADFLKVEDLTDLCAARVAKEYLKYDNAQKDAIFLGGASFTGKEGLARDHALREKYPWADKEPEYEEEILAAANAALKGAAAAVAGGAAGDI